MGMCPSKSNDGKKEVRNFIQKLRQLQQEMNAVLKQREEDNEAFEREMMMFALKEAEWRRERKRLREEVRRLRRGFEERGERIRRMEEEEAAVAVAGEVVAEKSERFEGQSVETESSSTASLMLVEQMREERARRDGTVEKWKMLYLAIKNELDDLIRKTHQGGLHWKADEEDLVEDLQQDLKVKEETIEFLKAQIASMEGVEYKRKREVDILRQSLKIISGKKGINSSTAIVKSPSKPPRPTKKLIKLAFVN